MIHCATNSVIGNDVACCPILFSNIVAGGAETIPYYELYLAIHFRKVKRVLRMDSDVEDSAT